MGWHSVLEDHPDYVKAIGMISIENANVEMFFGSLLADILGTTRNVGQAIYWAPKSANPRLEILKATAEQVYKAFEQLPSEEVLDIAVAAEKQKADTLQRILKLIKRANSVIGRRHAIIHDVWGTDSKNNDVLQQPIKGALFGVGNEKRKPLKALKQPIIDMRSLIDDTRKLSSTARRKFRPTLYQAHAASGLPVKVHRKGLAMVSLK